MDCKDNYIKTAIGCKYLVNDPKIGVYSCKHANNFHKDCGYIMEGKCSITGKGVIIKETPPAFEVFYVDELTKEVTKSYKIWADGSIEGFPPGALIKNGIPCIEDEMYSKGLKMKRDDCVNYVRIEPEFIKFGKWYLYGGVELKPVEFLRQTGEIWCETRDGKKVIVTDSGKFREIPWKEAEVGECYTIDLKDGERTVKITAKKTMAVLFLKAWTLRSAGY
jgi:hypothetical protein